MLTTDELIASAKACGFDPAVCAYSWCANGEPQVWIRLPWRSELTGVYIPGIVWQPESNESQNWLCVKELLRRGYRIVINDDISAAHGEEESIKIEGPPEEFAAKALATIEGEK